MKAKKTICIILILVLVFWYPLAMIFGHISNFIYSNLMKINIISQFNSASSIDIAEVKMLHGKLVGNGNGIQFRCDILIKGEPDTSATETVQALKDKYCDAEIVIPDDNTFYIYHSNKYLTFSDKDFNESHGEGYYVIYVFDDSFIPFMGEFDVCGH